MENSFTFEVNVKKLLFILFILASCAHQKNSEMMSDENPNREVAAEKNNSCFSMVGEILYSSKGYKQAETLSDVQVRKFMAKYSREEMIKRLDDSLRISFTPVEYLQFIDGIYYKLAERSMKPTEGFTLTESKVIWALIEKQSPRLADEIILNSKANEGDLVAKTILRIPIGESRDDAMAAVRIVKKQNPNISDKEVVRLVEQVMGRCLK